MPLKFTTTDHSNTITSVMVTAGSKHRVRFHEDGKATAAVVTSSDPKVVKEKTKPILFDGRQGIWTIDLVGVAKGTATVTAKRKDGKSADLAVTVVDPIALPPDNEEKGLIVRLLLSESRTPSQLAYDAALSKKTMAWMLIVLHNRLKDPGSFSARGATTITEIVKAPNQFAGFESYPKLAAEATKRIRIIMERANDDNDALHAEYRQLVQNALDVASLTKLPSDPSPNGLIGWRTAGRGGPGSNFIEFDVPTLGNQFYQWKKKP